LLALQFKPRVLVGHFAGDHSDVRHGIEDQRRWPTFLRKDGLDDLAGLDLGEAVLAQELGAILAGPLGNAPDATAERRDASVPMRFRLGKHVMQDELAHQRVEGDIVDLAALEQTA
jgi:hypothetical protein